jgi:hypothetical protein
MASGDHTVVPPPDPLATVASTLHVDVQGAEVIAALDAAGVPSIVLKGRAFATLLYPREARPYDDTDLLVPASSWLRAEEVLRALGYADRTATPRFEPPLPVHAHQWTRAADGAQLDLHDRLLGTRAPAAVVWAELAARAVPLQLGGRAACGLDGAGSAVVCALHLAAHPRNEKPREDLSRALRVIAPAQWRVAWDLAGRLGAGEPFVAGLRLIEDGAALADALALPASLSAARRLRADPAAPSSARQIATLLAQPSRAGRIYGLGRVVFPRADRMRVHDPVVRRGGSLALAYAVRPLRLVAIAPRAMRVWWRARRDAARL